MLTTTATLRSQTGAALLLLVLLALNGSISLFLFSYNSEPRKTKAVIQERINLQTAKEALIARALYGTNEPGDATDDSRPGALVCPDSENIGAVTITNTSCSRQPIRGRIPYRTLELEKIVDRSGEVLWYVMSTSFRDRPGSNIINAEKRLAVNDSGALELDGNRFAALIIVPGSPIGDQAEKRLLNRTNVSAYLEDENADDDLLFTNNPDGSIANFNDVIIGITHLELMQAVITRVRLEAARHRWCADLTPVVARPNWFCRNSWHLDTENICPDGFTGGNCL